MERTSIEIYARLLWQLNDPVRSSSYSDEERTNLLDQLFHSLLGRKEIEDYLKEHCLQSICFDINDFILFLHNNYGTILRPKIAEEHTNNEIFSEMDQEFLVGFFIGYHESEQYGSRYGLNSGIIKGWKQIKELSVW